MRETAVFSYIMAVFAGVATVAFGFTSLVQEHVENAGLGLIVGAASMGLLWSMGNWIDKNN
jgi:hypothetical protein